MVFNSEWSLFIIDRLFGVLHGVLDFLFDFDLIVKLGIINCLEDSSEPSRISSTFKGEVLQSGLLVITR